MTPLLDRKLVFVTGKGGVGKSTVAAALAQVAGVEGRRTLVVDVEGKGDLASLLEIPRPGFEPEDAGRGVWAMTLDTESALREYLRQQLRIPLVARIGPLARSLDFVATAAPGVREILTVGKVAWEVRDGEFDLVVVDGPATGHIVGQLAAPAGIQDLVKVGMIRHQTEWMLDMLGDPTVTGVAVVTQAAEMPVQETIELMERLRLETPVDLAAVIVNRVLPELFTKSDDAVVSWLRRPTPARRLAEVAGPAAVAVVEGAVLAAEQRRHATTHLDRLVAALPPGLHPLLVPEVFARSPGRRVVTRIAEALGAELS